MVFLIVAEIIVLLIPFHKISPKYGLQLSISFASLEYTHTIDKPKWLVESGGGAVVNSGVVTIISFDTLNGAAVLPTGFGSAGGWMQPCLL